MKLFKQVIRYNLVWVSLRLIQTAWLFNHSQINGTNSEIAVPRTFRAKAAVKILYYRIFLRSPRAQSEKSEIEVFVDSWWSFVIKIRILFGSNLKIYPSALAIGRPDNEMARNIARVKLKTIISLWNYRFYLNRKIL
jgi:hypothetical protein